MEATTRKIVHIDMDAFYASVEQRDDPSLRGHPVVVAWKGPRSVVCAASYEARRYGIRSAMPAITAERLCPNAIFVPPDFARYQAVSHQIRAIFRRHTSRIEPLSLDEAYLDVTHPVIPSPSATATAEAIRQAIFEETELTASAGVAPNKLLAKIASDWNKPNGIFVIKPIMAQSVLAPLSVGRLPGVGKVMEARLAEQGIATVAHLQAMRPETLEAHFGHWGMRLHQLAFGIDERPVEPDRPTMQVSCEDTFEADLPIEALEPHVYRLAERTFASYLKERERDRQRMARTITLKLKTADFKTLTRSQTQKQPPPDATSLGQIAWQLRQRAVLPKNTRFRLVGVGLSGFSQDESTSWQPDLFDVKTRTVSGVEPNCRQ